MTHSPLSPIAEPASSQRRNIPAWAHPTVSPEHGVYVVLLVSLLTGAAAAQSWDGTTTLAAICAFCGFQAEHPLVVQLRQRTSLKPRLVLWGSVYGGIAAAIALYLYWQSSTLLSPLLWVYGGAIAALLFDCISVLHREQKSVLNEIVTFAAVCLAAPFVYIVTTGGVSAQVIGLWLLNTLFFSSSIFTVKLRKLKKAESLTGVLWRLGAYHIFATGLVVGLLGLGYLSPVTASTFGIALVKASGICWQQQWYRTTQIRNVALIETLSALLFCLTVALSVLPVR